jgi:hypothetical protein
MKEKCVSTKVKIKIFARSEGFANLMSEWQRVITERFGMGSL